MNQPTTGEEAEDKAKKMAMSKPVRGVGFRDKQQSYICRYCDIRETDPEKHRLHVEFGQHRWGLNRTCSECDLKMTRAVDLRRHLREAHQWCYPTDEAPPRTGAELQGIGWRVAPAELTGPVTNRLARCPAGITTMERYREDPTTIETPKVYGRGQPRVNASRDYIPPTVGKRMPHFNRRLPKNLNVTFFGHRPVCQPTPDKYFAPPPLYQHGEQWDSGNEVDWEWSSHDWSDWEIEVPDSDKADVQEKKNGLHSDSWENWDASDEKSGESDSDTENYFTADEVTILSTRL
ncbi:MAG: hypothetical protein CEE38_23715 [Planctomycetes bacterium B3_Pla]|nr:MAG: hypothetical protein CEE38_23715 [Planctomycetes bacterium B3_Pla]